MTHARRKRSDVRLANKPAASKTSQNFLLSAWLPQPQNHWISDTPSYKIRVTVNGDKGTLYFECDYVDSKTNKVVSAVAADQNVQRVNGKWLITSSAGATPSLNP